MKHFESFESNRWIWRVNLALQVLLVTALVLVVNVLGMSVWTRYDLTKNRVYSLSGEARSYVHRLPGPVHVTVTLSANVDDSELAQAYRDVRGILREFEYAAKDNRNAPIHVEFLNVFQDRTRAESVQLLDTPNVVVLDYEGPADQPKQARRRRVLQLSDLYVTSGAQRNQFVGERAIAAGLLEVTNPNPPILYFLTGHGEMRLDDIAPGRGASTLDNQLRVRAYDTRELDLAATRRVPDDGSDRTNLVLILGPQTPLLRSEQELLRDYLTKRAGRIILTLDPGRNHGLDDLLGEWGILADDVLVIESDPRYRTEANELYVRNIAAEHPITRSLVDARIPLVFGAARSVRPDPGRPLDDALVVSELFRSSPGTPGRPPTSWGEANYRDGGTPVFDRGRDLPGPITMGTVSERRVDQRLKVNVQGGRLVVFGSSDFLANQRLGLAGNLTLLLNAVNWALDPERHVNIPARPIERLKLNLSEQQLFIAGLAIILGPSLAVTLLGLAVYFSRRR